MLSVQQRAELLKGAHDRELALRSEIERYAELMAKDRPDVIPRLEVLRESLQTLQSAVAALWTASQA